ncbi:GNAT family N-acetyltransferase [Burkholderia sp. 22PA0106]|uniref:GNAT family N-acetyltransferase n=1 Tax=Burkholderia sp. 22PA0106 TaxID=3237371 RepID=UPI0039C3CED8
MSSSTSAPSSSPSLAALEWRWRAFDALSAREVHAILEARSAVFVVEQQCVYADIDQADLDAWHLGAHDAEGRLAGYLRVLLPDAGSPDVRIGRVLTTAGFRGIGLGNALLANALERIRAQWPGTPISLHAQAHLQKYYGAFGFAPDSDIHEEDGIPHVWMRSAG